MLVYKVTNLVNGKVYIGKTHHHTLEARWQEHVWEAKRGNNTYFKKAIRKYGESGFVIELLCRVSTENLLNKQEKHFIRLYDSMNSDKGYNLTPGGDGASWWAGKKRSPESIAKMVATRRKDGTFTLNVTPEQIAKRVASRRVKGNYKERVGCKHTPETLEKMKRSAILRSAKKQAQAKSLYASGLSISAIAEQMKMSLGFVRKYATAV